MRINFDFTDLETFLAVYDSGSFHAASDLLGLSQPSISRRISKLESALDTALFDRTTRAVSPTLAAKRLKVRAEVILGETRETARSLRDESVTYQHQRAKTLTVAAIPTVISGLLAPAILQARGLFPALRVRIIDCAANEAAEAVAQGDADLAVCPVPAHQPGTVFDLLFNDQMVMAVLPDHPFTSRAAIAWSELSGEKLILPTRGTGNRMLIDDALARAGLPMPWDIEVARSTTALDLVSRGCGVAPVPSSAIAAHNRADIAGCPVISPEVSRPIGVLTRAGRRTDELSGAFAKILSRLAEQSHPGDRDLRQSQSGQITRKP